MDTQDKFMKTLEKELPDHLEMVVNKSYHNDGVIFIQPVESFECVLMIRFNFQTNYCTFEISPVIAGSYRIEQNSTMVYVPSPFEKLGQLIEDIKKYLLS
jgi:hypothetical protein